MENDTKLPKMSNSTSWMEP